MKKMRRVTTTGSVAAVLMLTAACGGGGGEARGGNSVQPVGAGQSLADAYGSGPGDLSGTGAGSASGGDEAGGAKGGPAGQLAVREIASVGGVVTDGAGLTLYRFEKDTPEPPKSNCDGDCAKAWPPVPAGDATASAGIEAGLLGSVTRSDGTKQLTLAGWPVYRYAKDTRAGEANGEGVGGTWHALAPDGKKAVDKKKGGGQAGTGMGMGMGGGSDSGGYSKNPDKELSVASNEKLGKILVDGQWRTLYRFDKDSAWPMKVTCVGACAETWKPAAPVDKSKASGIRPELIGTVKRPDGSEQLTIDCWPVYTFTGDTQPGQTSGHNKQGLWFAVTETGKKAPVSAG
ncbi:SCO0930 family lipoprotein [Streptomyces toxytricini]|uniref:SCO0930 family lipoprotein n=1 Tax=Streptomyces TaxID=1883 RepID=UPI001985E677|nr:lipoprotein [Streptomyces toxytricini]